ncbi:MAG: hypothetical protein R3277_04300 [Brumimicrobium sp.]|nr:hypothetical protein [Brumimicrobium sp.]
METKLKYILLQALFILSGLNGTLVAQYSAGGGITTIHGANIDITRVGIHGFFEQPRTEINTFFLRGTLTIPQRNINTAQLEAKTFGVTPQKIDDVRVIDKTSFFAVDGGTRIYFINTYDASFALYGGGHLKGIISSYSRSFDLSSGISPDDYFYVVNGNYNNVENVRPVYSLLFSFGGNFGAKYQLPYRGAITFDVALDLISRLYDPGGILGQEISPLSLSFNLAYRFDWY